MAFSKENVNLNNIQQYEYLRWKYDYYKNDNIEFTSYPSFFSASLVTVYGKYFLYKNWLEEQIKEITSKKNIPNIIQQNKREINNEFINDLRLLFSTMSYHFGCDLDNKEIVPENLTHGYLLNKFPEINENILSYYYKNTADLITEEFIEKLEKTSFIGNVNRLLKPYSLKIFGAWLPRRDFSMKLELLYKLNYMKSPIKYFEDLIPYFIEYSDGFEYGFTNFEENHVKPYLLIENDKEDFVLKVFEFIKKQSFLEHSWLGGGRGIGFTLMGNNLMGNNMKLASGYDYGKEQGYFYMAWCLIFKAHTQFTKHFKELSEADKIEIKDDLKVEIINRSQSPEKFSEDNLLYELIDDHLEEELFAKGDNYSRLREALYQYFTTGEFTKQESLIISMPRKARRIGWALNSIHKEASQSKPLSYEFLEFAKLNISIFTETPLSKDNFRSSTLYKYFTQNPIK